MAVDNVGSNPHKYNKVPNSPRIRGVARDRQTENERKDKPKRKPKKGESRIDERV